MFSIKVDIHPENEQQFRNIVESLFEIARDYGGQDSFVTEDSVTFNFRLLAASREFREDVRIILGNAVTLGPTLRR